MGPPEGNNYTLSNYSGFGKYEQVLYAGVIDLVTTILKKDIFRYRGQDTRSQIGGKSHQPITYFRIRSTAARVTLLTSIPIPSPWHALRTGCRRGKTMTPPTSQHQPPKVNQEPRLYTQTLTGRRGSGHCNPPRSLYTIVSRKLDGELGERTTYST